MTPKRNVAHRMGRWSGLHPKTAIFGWIAFVLIAFAVGTLVGTKTLDSTETGVGESGRAAKTLHDADFDEPAGEMVLIQATSGKLSDAEYTSIVGDLTTRLDASGVVASIDDPQRSEDGRSALVSWDLAGDPAKGVDQLPAMTKIVDEVEAAHPGVTLDQAGGITFEQAIDDKLGSDFEKAEKLSIPITLVILVLAFGAIVAAGIPVLLSLSSVFSAIGLLGVASQVLPVSEQASIVMMLLGMAVGVDYSLFYLKREREERRRGAGPLAALEAAAATSGRAVLISGFTVMIATAGMYLSGDADSFSFATGSILVVGVAVLGSLTVLPAVLVKLGGRVHKSRLPLLSRLGQDRDSRVWGWILAKVLHRPVVSIVVAGAVLLALAAPALHMKTMVTGPDDLSRSDFPVMKTYDKVTAAFPSEKNGASVVVKAADVTSPEMQAAIAELDAMASTSSAVTGDLDMRINADKTVVEIGLPLAGSGTDETSMDSLAVVRDTLVPATVGSVPGATADVTGGAAMTKDYNDNMASHAPLVFAFVLSMAFILLLMTFRSIVIPIKALILNLVSVAASYGLLTLLFQDGWGKHVGLEQTNGIVSWLPMFLFVLLFGLSMDYHVFILSRVRELWDRGASNDEAVSQGIKSSAGVVTAAATVMVAVFAIFASLSLIDLKQMGIGLAAAVLIDATIIRGVLLPATMKLLGKWNWWMPRSLQWLPELSHGSATPSATAAA
jgi:RND superfamily putative drug exporter